MMNVRGCCRIVLILVALVGCDRGGGEHGETRLLALREQSEKLWDQTMPEEYHLGPPDVELGAVSVHNDAEYLYVFMETEPSVHEYFEGDGVGSLAAILLKKVESREEVESDDRDEWWTSADWLIYVGGTWYFAPEKYVLDYDVNPPLRDYEYNRFDMLNSLEIDTADLVAHDEQGLVIAVPLAALNLTSGDIIGVHVEQVGGIPHGWQLAAFEVK